MKFKCNRRLAALAGVVGMLAAAPLAAQSLTALALPAPVTDARSVPLGNLDPAASRRLELVVRLSDPPLAAALGANAKKTGITWSAAQQRAYVAGLKAKQDALMAKVTALGGTELGRVALAYNAVMVSVDGARLAELSRIPGVVTVRPVQDHELDLSQTVPYIGARAAQLLGLDGTGVTVGVIDSGIDYTHRNLGGDGTLAAYNAAYTNPAGRDGLFPTGKVVAGRDFVGETWPSGARTEDDDPIDAQGHGTHVADIIAGQSVVGPTHVGVAPGARLVAGKACSAVATSCNGIALLLASEYMLDPFNTGTLNQAVDVINLSLGTSYGQRADDLSEVLAIIARFGVVVVASAGNSGDRPYITGSPSVTPEVISVAQTQVPGAAVNPLVVTAPAAIAGVYTNTEVLDWAPIGAGFTGSVAYVGRGCGADAYLADPAGKVALIDRGTCNVSEKVAKATGAGAIGVLIGLVAPGDAVSFSNGGQCPTLTGPCLPSLVITQATSNALKANIAAGVVATVSPATAIPLVGSVVGSSARGPSYSYNAIKPDIGAPGASLSAQVGTGDGETTFGGTSGAAPMVAGSVALLLQKKPQLTPSEVKAQLMNAAERAIYTNPATQPGGLAPVTRIGGGEVRIDRSLALQAAAWDSADSASVSLSFGYTAVSGPQVLRKKVTLRNYASVARTFTVRREFRYANDEASGAVALSFPATVNVPANGSVVVPVNMTINTANLPAWVLDGGSGGGTGSRLQTNEFDGYLLFTGGGETVSLPWHVLPHKVANAKAGATSVALGGAPGAVALTNAGGAIGGVFDAFQLTGTSPKLPLDALPRPGENFAVVDLRAVGLRLVSAGGTLALQFAVNTWGVRAHPAYPAEFDVYIDTNNDGTYDYVAWTQELNGGSAFAADGRTVVYVQQLGSGAATAYFYVNANLDSANAVLTVPLSALGITSLSTTIRFSVYAFDNYFTGLLTDGVEDMVVKLDQPAIAISPMAGTVPVGGSSSINLTPIAGGGTASPGQIGALFLYQDAKPGAEADAVLVTP